MPKPSPLGHIDKAVTVIPVEHVATPLRDLGAIQQPAVDQEDIQVAIVVVVDKTETGPVRLHDVGFVVATTPRGSRDAHIRGDIHEVDGRRWIGRRDPPSRRPEADNGRQ